MVLGNLGVLFRVQILTNEEIGKCINIWEPNYNLITDTD